MLAGAITGIDGGEDKITYTELKKLQDAIAILESVAMIPDLDQFYESRFLEWDE